MKFFKKTVTNKMTGFARDLVKVIIPYYEQILEEEIQDIEENEVEDFCTQGWQTSAEALFLTKYKIENDDENKEITSIKEKFQKYGSLFGEIVAKQEVQEALRSLLLSSITERKSF